MWEPYVEKFFGQQEQLNSVGCCISCVERGGMRWRIGPIGCSSPRGWTKLLLFSLLLLLLLLVCVGLVEMHRRFALLCSGCAGRAVAVKCPETRLRTQTHTDTDRRAQSVQGTAVYRCVHKTQPTHRGMQKAYIDIDTHAHPHIHTHRDLYMQRIYIYCIYKTWLGRRVGVGADAGASFLA